MEERQTHLANTIDATDYLARYDRQAKLLLSHKSVLAWILKSCVAEFSEATVEYIAEHCIEGKPEVSEHPLHQNVKDGRIVGMNTESNSLSEHTIRYDIRFKAITPETSDLIELIINVEIQAKTTSEKLLIKRGIYYCSRMISEQYGTEFDNEEYDKIKKVVSIWVCPTPAKKAQDSINNVGLCSESLYGQHKLRREDYDLMQVVIISLNDEDTDSEEKIIRLLSVLLSARESPEEKKRLLSEEFGIPMTEELMKEVYDMCNLSQVLVIRTENEVNERVATDMLTDGKPLHEIERYSKLSEDEIRKLADKLGVKVVEG